MARYTIQASNSMGAMALQSPMSAAETFEKAVDLKSKGFTRIIVKDVDTGGEIENMEDLLKDPDA